MAIAEMTRSLRAPDPNRRLEVPSSSDGRSSEASRWWLLGALALSLAAVLPEAFGRQFVDTKLDLTTSPTALLGHIVNLWDPNGWFGYLQDQYQGYAFPVGPFFALGHYLAVPPWITERVWMALLLTTAFWGVVRLAEALEIGSLPTRIAGGVVYAMWPVFTILVGINSSAIAPGVLLPWVLLPLVKGSRSGSTLRAAALSGLAVLFIGGVNAADTLDVLVVPALFLLTRQASRRRRSLAGWWVLCTGLATMWWLIPLVFLGKYGFNFLPYTEQAVTTTSTTSAPASLLGIGDWVAYLSFGNQLWDPGGSILVTYPMVILGTAVTAAAGLFGLARRELREGLFIRLVFAVGAVCTMAAYWGPFGGPLGHILRPLLNSGLAPFRNVFKFEPLLALPIALGMVHALQVLRRHLRRTLSVVAVSVLAVACFAALAWPYVLGSVSAPQSFTSIPKYWYQTADYLATHAPHTDALVVPASAHGLYAWGWTIDEPLEALAKSPWVDREVAPYSGAGSTRVVDAVDQALRAGTPQPGLQELLHRSGISYVVVQNDVEGQLSDSPSPLTINTVLDDSGLSLATSFGPTIKTYAGNEPTLRTLSGGFTIPYPAIQIFKVSGANTPVESYPVASAALASGGPEADLQLFNQGVIKENQAVVLAGDSRAQKYTGPLFAVTDTLRRGNNSYGLVNDNASYTLTARQQVAPNSGSPDGAQPPRQMLPFAGVEHQTVAEFAGAKSVDASSYGSWVMSLPEYNPANVFDNDSSTGWAAGSSNGSVGQWIQITFNHPQKVTGTSIKLLTEGSRAVATEVLVSTNKGSVVDHLTPEGSQQDLRAPPGTATWLRVTFEKTTAGQLGEAGIRQIAIPGLHVQPYLKPPQESEGNGAEHRVFSFQTTQVDPRAILRSSPEPVLARQFSTSRTSNTTVTGRAQPIAGAKLDNLLHTGQLKVSASSSFDTLPTFRPDNLFDHVIQSDWVASGRKATLKVSWPKPQTLSQLSVVFAQNLIAAKPKEILIKSIFGSRLLHVPTTGGAAVINFKPLTTDAVQISFPEVQRTRSLNALGKRSASPVGLAELEFPPLQPYQAAPPNVSSVFLRLCGGGPQVSVDGHTYSTSVWGTYGQLESLQPLQFQVCQNNLSNVATKQPGPFTPLHVALNKGEHHALGVKASVSGVPFTVSGLTISSDGPSEKIGTPRAVSTLQWGSENRSVRVGSGVASYLEVHQNYSSGWVATMNGKQLTPVVLDGWQQGYVIPAGAGGTVHMTFEPESLYLLGLLVGALGVIALCLIVVVTFRRKGRLGHWGEGYESAGPWRPSLPGVVAVILCSVVIFIIGGPLVLAVPVLLVVSRLRPRALPWIAFAGVVVAGLASTHDVGNGAQSGIGAFGDWAQLAAVVAIAAVLTPARRPGTSPAEGVSEEAEEGGANESNGWHSNGADGMQPGPSDGASPPEADKGKEPVPAITSMEPES